MTTSVSATEHRDGLVLHAAARHYDRLAWLLTLGRERALRARMLDLARVTAGESVLDVGCGTGTLAAAAKRRVGPGGSVLGIDASAEMIEQATRKAARARVDVSFHVARVQALPFPDAHFDVVLCTLMLHHLPRPARELCVREIRRVLRPGGRVLAVDFERSARRGFLSRLHRHGHVPLEQIVGLLRSAGLDVVERGAVGLIDLRYALARPPGAAGHTERATDEAYRTLPPIAAPRWLMPVGAIALLAGHGVALRAPAPRLALSALALGAGVAAVAIAHGAIGLGVHRAGRRR